MLKTENTTDRIWLVLCLASLIAYLFTSHAVRFFLDRFATELRTIAAGF